ncbi:MAG: DUF1214 domain-containing protein [Deltaproteobacteria bacterium]|jgi:hypothetical protein|nr:DUF1214 domain-containing protein [Deltaproteobacteria bacterium]
MTSHPRSQKAWNDFADSLKRIGEKITAPTGARGPRERAEGYRYLLRLISAAHDLEMEADRRYPDLRRMMTPIRKFKGDGTDTMYHEAKLDEELVYKFSIRRGDDLFFSATVYAYDEDDAYYIVDHLIDDDIEWENVFGEQIAEIYLSEKRPERVRNWIELKGKRPILFTREYFEDFVDALDDGRLRGAAMKIECLSEVPRPEPYDEEQLEEGLRKVTDFIEDATDVSLGLSIFIGLNRIEYEGAGDSGTSERKGSMTRIEEGNLVLDEESSEEYTPEELAAMIDPKLVKNNLPGPGIQYIGGTFKLAPDEVIVVEGGDVPCRYWNLQILTRYLESGDFRHHKVGISNRQVVKDADGSFRIYAAADDPGTVNWISTQGYANGQILIRTLLADPLMEATFKVIKAADIPDRDKRPS